VPWDVCRRLRALPLAVLSHGDRRVIRVAMADPTDGAALAELENLTGCEIAVTLTTLSAIEESIEDGYRAFVTEVVPRKKPFGGSLAVATQPMARGARPVDDGSEGAPATIPYHRLSDEADLALRHQALLALLYSKQLVTEDEYEEAVRDLLKRRAEE
jgi:hypothetical protein